MKDMTLRKFCKKYDACPEGYRYGVSLTTKGENATMSEVWSCMDNLDYMLWVLSRPEVLSKVERVALAVRFIKETPLHDGRTVFDLITDPRSIEAIKVCEKYIAGKAAEEDLDAAYAAYAAADAAKKAQVGIIKSIKNPFISDNEETQRW